MVEHLTFNPVVVGSNPTVLTIFIDVFVLASSSRARSEILNKLGFRRFHIESPEILELAKDRETPREFSVRLAKEKGAKVAALFPEKVVLSADTVVCIGRRVIDKAENIDDVIHAMTLLSGKRHRVFTTICTTFLEKQKIRTVETRIKFKRLTEKEIESFAKTGEGIGKAGGYTISGIAESFILGLNGSVSGVIGLPSYETSNLLKSYDIYPSF